MSNIQKQHKISPAIAWLTIQKFIIFYCPLDGEHTIAGLVRDGRYFYSYMPTGVYAELRNASNRRFVLVEEQTRAKNRLQKWIAVYFQEYKGVYTHIDAKGGLLVLKEAPTPEEIVKLGEKDIIKIWKDAKLRGNGHKKGNEYPECGNEKHRIKSRPYRSMDGDTGSDRGL